LRGTKGLSGGSADFVMGGWGSIVVGSVAPLSLIEGGVLLAMARYYVEGHKQKCKNGGTNEERAEGKRRE
jgi:hypothetical protein